MTGCEVSCSSGWLPPPCLFKTTEDTEMHNAILMIVGFTAGAGVMVLAAVVAQYRDRVLGPRPEHRH